MSFNINRGLLGFKEKLPCAPYSETVVWGLGRSRNLDGILMNHILILFGIPGLVGHIPAEGFKEGVNELLSKLSFVVCTRAVGFAIALKPLNEFKDFFGSRDLALLSLLLLDSFHSLEE